MTADERFVVARNPNPDSALPYLLRLPVDGGLVLKAREQWPATSRVYCHPAEGWPAESEVLAAVERKTVPDLSKGLVDGSLPFAMAELAALPAAAVVIEGRYSDLF